eukprot:TRINITY_DN3114_c0_g1_i3.p1 TRINITY_DN3114_c0_g1~~TRINITY_DN3114_c0_g1_i3.p1  ORF type:complete len:151 (-),score=44.76 TRINITY_DN3114_c0_g1_i3:26-478(-)
MNLGEDEEKAADSGAGGVPEGETVIDIVDRFDLKETKYDKKSFQAYAKLYLNKVKKYLQDKGKADRVAEFQKGALEIVKMILKNFDDFQFFTGNNMEDEVILRERLNLSFISSSMDWKARSTKAKPLTQYSLKSISILLCFLVPCLSNIA